MYPSIDEVLERLEQADKVFFEDTMNANIRELLMDVNYDLEYDRALKQLFYGRLSPQAQVLSDEFKYEIVRTPPMSKRRGISPVLPVIIETNPKTGDTTTYYWQGEGYYVSEDGLQIKYGKQRLRDRLKRFFLKPDSETLPLPKELLQDIKGLNRIEMARLKHYCTK